VKELVVVPRLDLPQRAFLADAGPHALDQVVERDATAVDEEGEDVDARS
jgi:hypothetical protein